MRPAGWSRRRLAPALSLLSAPVVLGAAACGTGEQASAGGRDSVYIAVAAGLGGSNAAYFDGVRLAVEKLNQGLAHGAPPFGVRAPSSAGATQVAIAAAFRDDPAVIGVVGHTGSAQTLEAAPVYGDVSGGGRHAVVAISPGATNPAISGVSPWVFRDCPTDDNMAAAMATYAVDSLHALRIALIYRNDLFGRGFARAFTAAFEQRGGIVVERDPYLAGITAHDAYVRRMARGSIQALIIAGGASEAGPLLHEVRAVLGDIPVVGTDDMASVEADGNSARDLRGVHYAAFYLPAADSASPGGRFAADYRRRFGREPDTRAALAYDAAMVIGLAAREVGPDRRKVRDWIASVGRGRSPYRGVTGDIHFDSKGDAVGKPVFITEVKP